MALAALNQNSGILSDVLKLLVSVIDEKDEYLRGHSVRVATNCLRFSSMLGISKSETTRLMLAGLLNDIGMVYIPPEILHKPGNLSEDEMIVVKKHPVIAEKILSKTKMFSQIVPIIRHHHEACDGSGYPDGLTGNQISDEAKILGLVNSFEAMVSHRPYRVSLSTDEALEQIRKSAGQKFDQSLVGEFGHYVETLEKSPSEMEEFEENENAEDAIIKIIKKIKSVAVDLPILPAVVEEIKEVMGHPHTTVEDLAEVVERDATISVRLISIANSPMFRGSERIHTVRQAMPRLGIHEIKSIVRAISSRSLFITDNEPFKALMEKLWLHSLACAHCSRSLAKKLRIGNSEKIFLMGLIHDIGKAPIIKLVSEKAPKDDSWDLKDVIEGIQDAHTSFGSSLLKRWGFTQDFCRIAMRHEGPKFSSLTEEALLIVNLANNLTQKIGYSLSENDKPLSDLDSTKLLKIDTDTLNSVGDETINAMQTVSGIFW